MEPLSVPRQAVEPTLELPVPVQRPDSAAFKIAALLRVPELPVWLLYAETRLIQALPLHFHKYELVSALSKNVNPDQLTVVLLIGVGIWLVQAVVVLELKLCAAPGEMLRYAKPMVVVPTRANRVKRRLIGLLDVTLSFFALSIVVALNS